MPPTWRSARPDPTNRDRILEPPDRRDGYAAYPSGCHDRRVASTRHGETSRAPCGMQMSRPRIPHRVYGACPAWPRRSEEHTSELQSLMRISYAVFCLKKKKKEITESNRPAEHNNQYPTDRVDYTATSILKTLISF